MASCVRQWRLHDRRSSRARAGSRPTVRARVPPEAPPVSILSPPAPLVRPFLLRGVTAACTRLFSSAVPAVLLERIPFALPLHEAVRLLVVVGHRWIRIPNPRGISGPRFCEQELEHRVVAVLCLQLRDAAVRIFRISEDNRLRRAGLLARGLDRAVSDFHVTRGARFHLLRDLRLFDALQTERA